MPTLPLQRHALALRPGTSSLWAACALACLLGLWPQAAGAQGVKAPEDDPTSAAGLPRELEGVGIDGKAGTQLPADVALRDQFGQPVQLSHYFDGKRPVVLVLAYYSCPMLCTLVLNGVTEGLKDVGWTMGHEYRVVTVSIDPRDGAEVALKKRSNYVRSYGRLVPDDAWDFLTGDEAQVKRLADALGFRYHWDEAQGQYVHAAGAFVVTPRGVLSRVFYGLSFAGQDLRLALLEASEGKIGSAVDKLLLFCFHYAPQQGRYVLAATRLMRAGGVLTALLLAAWLVAMWRRDRRRARPDSPLPPPAPRAAL